MSDAPARERKGGRTGSRLPLLVALTVVGGLLAAYWLYVRDRREYYVHRNLRILGSFSTQLDDAFTTHVGFVRNYARATDWQNNDRDALLRGFAGGKCSVERQEAAEEEMLPEVRSPSTEIVRGTLRDRNGETWAEIAWAGMVPLRDQPSASKPVLHCYQMPLAKILEPVLRRDAFGAFDAVFLANAKGQILYSFAPPHAPSTLLWSSVRHDDQLHAGAVVAQKLVLTNIASAEQSIGFLGRQRENIKPASLRDATRNVDVQISGDSYVLFSQPYAFRHPSSDDAKKAPDGDAWIVGGIVEKQRFRSDAAAISASKVAGAIALCVLAICAWPFLRILLMTERQPLTITDVVLLLVCTGAGVMLLTLSILDALAYQRLSTQTDTQLRSFARKVERDFTRNIISASKLLGTVETWAEPRLGKAQSEWNLIARAVGYSRIDDECEIDPTAIDPEEYQFLLADAHTLFQQPDVRAYPYFLAFSWIKPDGMQAYTAAGNAREPLVSVTGHRYFREAFERRTWDAKPRPDGREQYPYALEWVQSPTTGETQAVIARPTGNPERPVAALTTQLIDVSLSVPPPGVKLALIDEQGNVVYHSDQQRIGHENFFAETDHNRKLRAAVLGRTDAIVSSNYWGEDQRMFVHPVANTPWTLITFRGKRLVRAVNIEALLLAVIGLTVNALPYILLGAVILILKPWYRAPSLWPDPSRRSDYVRLTSVLALAAVTMAIVVYALEPRFILPFIIVLPVQALLSCYVLLHRHDRRRTSLIALACWIAVTFGLFALCMVAKVDADLLVSAKPARVRWLLFAVMLFQFVVALKLMTREEREGKPNTGPEWLMGFVATPLRRILVVIAFSALAVALAFIGLESSRTAILVVAALQTLVSIAWVSRDDWEEGKLLHLRIAWALATAALILFVGVCTSWLPDTAPDWAEAGIPIAFILSSVVALIIADGRFLFQCVDMLRLTTPSMRYPLSYRFAGVLTLVVCAVMPTIGYFKLASRVEQEALIKYAQLRLAAQTENRINNIGRMLCSGEDCLPSLADAARRDALAYRIANVWNTLWTFADKEPLRERREAPLSYEYIADLIPQYSEDSVAMRQLYADGSADRLWSWREDGRLLTLDRLVRLDAIASKALFPRPVEHGAKEEQVRQQVLRFSSYVPLLFPSLFSLESTRPYVVTPIQHDAVVPVSGTMGIAYTLFAAGLLAAGVAVLFWVVRFMTDRVLLLDVQEPLWLEPQRGEVLGAHVFLTRRDEPLENVLGPRDPLLFTDIHFSALDRDGSWSRTLLDLDKMPAPTVRIADFEHGDPGDFDLTAKKLGFLEKLAARVDCRVLLVSTFSPAYFLRAASPKGKYAQRWSALFEKFLCITWEELEFRRRERERVLREREGAGDEWSWNALVLVAKDLQGTLERERRRMAERWLEAETATSPYLRRIASQLQPHLDREQILDELRERAEAYYASLWSSCSEDEKLLVFHLARHGFVHARNRRTLRRLIARGLVRRSPNLELMSESFRLYVLAAAQQENLVEKVREIANEGVWKTLRVPLFIVIISFLLLLFTTQKDLLTMTTGLAAALTTGIPVLVNFFGMITQRRLESSPKTR